MQQSNPVSTVTVQDSFAGLPIAVPYRSASVPARLLRRAALQAGFTVGTIRMLVGLNR
jgi:hypothetical protein